MEIKVSSPRRTYTAINTQEYSNQSMKLWIVSPTYYSDLYLVYADCESDAIDVLADYGQEKGYRGWFIDEQDTDDYDVIYAGNNGLPMDGDELHIKPAHYTLHNYIEAAMQVTDENQ